ncbi:unnamed protein product [Brachionus calyciflorus]|uniref:Band 7 domain-containing protein n=1 Tax=Brachionus calyciflorus TaxID=104777 RepID=A0A813MA50_9BILA|nr:unnamed protein product [Brachionus calyciflorus]
MDDVSLEDYTPGNNENDVNFEEEITSFYNSVQNDIPSSNTHNAQNSIEANSDSENEGADRPLIERTNEYDNGHSSFEATTDRNYGPGTSEETGQLISSHHGNTNLTNPTETSQNNRLNIRRRLNDYIKNEDKRSKLIGYGIVFLIVCMIFAINSFLYPVEYHEIGIVESKITGKLHDEAFNSGLNFYYPWFNLITFDRTVQSIELNETKIFSTDKLQIRVWFKVYYKLNPKKLVEFYRKFGKDYSNLLRSICQSELQILGQKFSIDTYRTSRLRVRSYFTENLKKRLENDYMISFFNLYMDTIKFTKEINRLNLVRVLTDISKEKAEHEKTTNLTVVETVRQVRFLKNQAKEIIESAKLKAKNQVLKMSQIDFDYKLELAHLDGFSKSIAQLNLNRKSQNDTQKALSFCYLSSLINNEKVRIIQPNDQIPSQGFSTKADHLIGILSI